MFSRHTLSQIDTYIRNTLRPTDTDSMYSQKDTCNHVERTGQTVGQTFADRKVRTHIRHALVDRQTHTEKSAERQEDTKTTMQCTWTNTQQTCSQTNNHIQPTQ